MEDCKSVPLKKKIIIEEWNGQIVFLSWKVLNSLASSQESQVSISLILRIWSALLVITEIKFQYLKAEHQDLYIMKSVITDIVQVQRLIISDLWSTFCCKYFCKDYAQADRLDILWG